MSSRLELPPERELPMARRREIRAALVRAARPGRRRAHAWFVAVPVAVLVVVLGLVLAHPWNATSPVVGVPSASPSPSPSESIDWSVAHGRKPIPTPAIPPAEQTDRGPLSRDAAAAVAEKCLTDFGGRTTVVAMLFARRTSTDGDVVLFTGRNGQSYLCSDFGAETYSGPGSKTKELRAPDETHPVVRILQPGLAGSARSTRHRNSTQAAYRVGPEVVSLQLRLTVDGHTGSWFEASMDDGWAWVGANLTYADPARLAPDADFRVEDRAFDADGHELAIDRRPR